MKRFTAILTVLCFALALFSCSSGGEAATTATSRSTAAQNTTEYTKTESTTSKTEAPKKPEFLHPATEEINESIDKTLSKENICAVISTDIFAEAQNRTLDTLYNCVKIMSGGMNSSSPTFLLESVTSDKYTSGTDTSIYFSDGSYYISELGVKAKIPASGVSGISTPKELLLPLIAKIDSDEYRVLVTVGEKENSHLLQIDEPKAGETFRSVVKAMSEAIARNTSREFSLSLKKAELNVIVNADCFLTSYSSSMEFSLVFTDGGENSELTLNVNTKVDFINEGNESAPLAPDDIASYTELSSQNEIPLLLFGSAAGKTSALESYRINELLDIRKKELNGSRVNITLNTQKSYASSEAYARWLENAVLQTVGKNDAKNFNIYCDGGFCFVKNGSDTVRYSTGEFKNKFLYSVNAPCIPILEISDVLSYTVRADASSKESSEVSLTLTDTAFAQKFSEYVGKAAYYTVPQDDIWSFKAKNNRVTLSVGSNGYIEKCEILFDIEVIVNINGSKFSFSAEVIDSVEFIAPGEEVQVTVPEWAKEQEN